MCLPQTANRLSSPNNRSTVLSSAEETLRKTEEKTGLVHRFQETQAAVEEIRKSLEALISMTQGPAKELAEDLSARVRKLKE